VNQVFYIKMRFSVPTIVVTLLSVATTTLAVPNALDTRAGSTNSTTKNAIAYAANSDSCEFFDCVGVIAAAFCVGVGIATDDPLWVLGCVAGGSGEVGYLSHFNHR
jgi:hypothetical protein